VRAGSPKEATDLSQTVFEILGRDALASLLAGQAVNLVDEGVDIIAGVFNITKNAKCHSDLIRVRPANAVGE
jgi:hypothetical protein